MTDPGTPTRITAVLGPTNTGKTHLAMERMLGHASGMIGFPLRLLARENYDKAVRRVGASRVALVTGEEKILPPRPSYFICTVESMPIDRRVDFLAIDEIQLCGDPERGHLFTERLLNARGREETMFLGAETMAPLIRKLVPGCQFDTRPRFSQLTYNGHRKLTRLPPRSAVVAFSADDVYAIAELVRRQRGGAAVVMGALSPRTRNAQVALYQSGEVDYLVATDAIGMGLNMDVDHVAFAALSKFDGQGQRGLSAQEVAQIAGRAGRHMNDGTFGVTGDAGPIAEDTVARVETHAFAPLRQIFWRNPRLDFRSVEALLKSLGAAPPDEGLMRPRRAEDQQALEILAQDPEIAQAAVGPQKVGLLWDVCRIPDFRKLRAETHVRLLGQIFRHLTAGNRRLPDDFVAGHAKRMDRNDGDIHALVDRIAGIRVWTYVSHQGDWLGDPGYWQEATRAIEDRLSDALHEKLTQRFVDRLTATLMRRLGERAMLDADVAATDGRVNVEGHDVGRLEGLTFHAEATGGREGDKAVLNAAQKALRREIGERVQRLAADDDPVFSLDPAGQLLWRGAPVARLEKGPEVLRPLVTLPAESLLDAAQAEAVKTRLEAWVKHHLGTRLKPLFALDLAPLKGAARGLAFQLAENLGTLSRSAANEHVDGQVRALSEADRKALARAGVRLGVECLFMPDLLKPDPQRLLAVLWRIDAGRHGGDVPADGRVSFPVDKRVPHAFYHAIGYRVVGDTAVRVDMIERFAADVRRLVRDALPAKGKPADVSATPAEAAPETAADSAGAGGDAATPTPVVDATTPTSVVDAAPETPGNAPIDTPAVAVAAVEGPSTEASAEPTEAPEAAAEAAPEAAVEADRAGEGGEEATAAAGPTGRPAKPEPPQAREGEVHLPPDMLPPLGIGAEEGVGVLTALGYGVRLEAGALFLRPRRRKVSHGHGHAHGAGQAPGRSQGGRGRGPAAARPAGEAASAGDPAQERKARPHTAGDRPPRDGEGRDKASREPRRGSGKGGGYKGDGKGGGGASTTAYSSGPRPARSEINPDSPFAKLRELMGR